MQTEAQKAARHLENALALRKIAEDMRKDDPKTVEKLIECAVDYERLATKLIGISVALTPKLYHYPHFGPCNGSDIAVKNPGKNGGLRAAVFEAHEFVSRYAPA